MWPFDDILDAVNGLYEFALAVIELIAYGPIQIIEAAYNGVVTQINLLITFLNAFVDLFNIINDGILGMFNGVYFDSSINWILSASLVVALMWRFYHFAQNVSIAGFKL